MKAKLIFIEKKQKIEVPLLIKLSGCLIKGYFTAKNGKDTFLSVKWPFVGTALHFFC